MDAEPADFDLPTLAALAGAAANAEVQRRLASKGHGTLKVSYGYVIQLLIDETPTIGAVSTALGVTQQAASKTIAEMEERGLVERVPDAKDRRAHRIRLTEAGERAVDSARAERRRLEDELGLDPVERDAARRALIGLLERSGGLQAARARRVKPAVDGAGSSDPGFS